MPRHYTEKYIRKTVALSQASPKVYLKDLMVHIKSSDKTFQQGFIKRLRTGDSLSLLQQKVIITANCKRLLAFQLSTHNNFLFKMKIPGMIRNNDSQGLVHTGLVTIQASSRESDPRVHKSLSLPSSCSEHFLAAEPEETAA